VGHFVNYRKQSSPSLQELLPECDYQLFAVCARYPQKLAEQAALTPLQEGVYEVRALGLRIKVIVVSQLPKADHNAMLHLFSAREELLRYGHDHYRPYSRDTSSLLYRLFQAYSEESDMPDKLKEFVRETIDEMVASLPAEELRRRLSVDERLKGLPAEELRKRLSVDERLKGLSAEELRKRLSVDERLKGLPAEERLKGMSAEELAKALPPETLEALGRRLKGNGSSSSS
jgi:hypothetical protein